MKKTTTLYVQLFVLFLTFSVSGQNIVTTIAGTGTAGYNGDNIPATTAQFSIQVDDILYDSQDNLYIADLQDARVRRIDDATGIITTVAGNGTYGFSGDGGLATNAMISPLGLAIDASGNLFIADDKRIRRVDAITGIITTIAGTGAFSGWNGDGIAATSANIFPYDMFFDVAGDLIFGDRSNSRIRRIDMSTGLIYTIGGDGTFAISGDGGLASNAQFYGPSVLTQDLQGNIYVSGDFSHRVRKIDAVTGIVTTVAGDGTYASSGDGGLAINASFKGIKGLEIDDNGNIFIGSQQGRRLRKVDISTGIVSTYAGTGLYGYNGDAIDALTANIYAGAMSFDSNGHLTFEDASTKRIREITPSAPSTFTIPDANFAAFLNATYPSIMSGSDLDIAGAATITGTMDCPSLNISDLSGIEFFTSITHLFCGWNNLTTLDVSNLNLTLMRAQHNDLTSITGLANNTNLTYFWVQGNELTDLIDIVNLNSMWSLNIGNNQLSNLPSLANFTNLHECAVSSNPDPATTLDVSNNTLLASLHCNNLNLSSIIGLPNTSFYYLNCMNNHITDLSDLANIPGMKTIWVGNNDLTSFPALNNFPLLQSLWIYANPLPSWTFDVTTNVNLTDFSCGNSNNVEAIVGLGNCVNLKNFNINNCNVSDLSELAAIPTLQNVYATSNDLTSFPTLINAINLKILSIGHNPYNPWNIDVSSNPNLTTLSITSCNIDSIIGLGGLTSLKNLYADFNNLSSIDDLENCLNLKVGSFSVNNLHQIPDLSPLTNLTGFRVQYNYLDFSDARELRIVNAKPTLTSFYYEYQNNFEAVDSINTCFGDTLHLWVAEQDSATSYQWYWNGAPISGATDADYFKLNFTVADTGEYYCESHGTALLAPPINFGNGTAFFTSETIIASADQTNCSTTTVPDCEGNKIQICHVPPGNPANAHTICVSPNAVAAHLAHGDYLGPCDENGNSTTTSQPNITLSAAPNPFSSQTTISVYLPEDSDISISIYNVHGIIEDQPVNGFVNSGDFEFTFDAMSNGVYTIVMTVNQTEVFTKRIVSIH